MALDSGSSSALTPISIHTLPEPWQDDQGPVTRPFSPRGATGNPNFSLLPPLNTSSPSPAPLAATPPHIPTPHSRASPALPNHASTIPVRSRPPSAVYPLFFSSLDHSNVRDFAYLVTNKLHYGPPAAVEPPPKRSTRAESKRKEGWRGEPGQGEGSPTNLDLSGTEFADGPPWKEDADLLSPVVRSAKHKKSKSGFSDIEGRGRIEERSGSRRSKTGGVTHDSGHAGESSTTYAHNGVQSHQPTTSYFPSHDDHDVGDESDDDESPAHSPTPFDDEDESRYSRDYQFHIASPDEEMHGKAVALFDFTRENENELPLLEGQVLWVSYRHGQGWLVAQDPKTGENGLVPEEYVRLIRDIEGGLSGLGNHLPGFSPGSEGQELGLSPDLETPVTTTSNVETAIPTTAPASMHERNPSSVSTAQSYTPIVSHFTTSSKDLEPYAGPRLDKGASPSPRVPQQSPTRSPVRLFRDHGQTAGYGQTSQMQSSSSSSAGPSQLPARSASQATDLIAFAREQMAEEEEEAGGRNGLGLKMDEGDEDEPVILEDAVAREIRRSQGPPV